MIIKRLILHNFGVYASTNMFEFKGKNPIVLIGGMNGRGKTTFLEAVLLALYGANSFAYNESKYKTFGQYLKSFVNVADGTLKTYVDLEFSMDASDNEIYNVHREWTGDKKRTTEKIQVYKNHEYNQFLTDNWTMFIENILPSGLSNFFFFDGEKIAELAVEKTSTQMKESIKALLGISVIDLLKSDLGRILNRIEKNKVGNSEATQIELLRDKKNMATVALENIDNEIEELISNKTAMQHELEILKQEYIARGGDIVTQRQDLFKKKSTVASKIENFREQLISDASSELPLVLVKELLRNIRENAEIEQDNKMLDIALRKMSRFSTDYKEENKFDSEAVARFMNFVNEKSRKKKYSVSYNLSDTALFKLQILLDEQLLDTKLNVKGHQDILEKLQMEADQLDNYLSVDIDEKAIAQIYKEIKVLEQKLIEIDVVLSRKNEERKTKNGVLLTSTAEFNKKVESYLKKMELNDDSDRIIKY